MISQKSILKTTTAVTFADQKHLACYSTLILTLAIVPTLYPLKRQKKLSGVFRAYKMETLARNRLITLKILIVGSVKLQIF